MTMRALRACGSLWLLFPSSWPSATALEHEPRASDDAALRWGPYRPNLYFGVRPQIPDTLLMGMMWGQGQDKATLIETLHDTCEQDDGVEGFGWTMYDTRFGGSQTIHDDAGHVDVKTDYMKTKDGNSWAVQVSGSLRPGAPDGVETAVVFHVALENSASDDTKAIKCMKDKEDKAGRHDARGFGTACYGEDPALGTFEFYVIGDANNEVVEGVSVKSMQVSEDMIWKAKSVFTKQALAGSSGGDGYLVNDPGVGNMHFLQMVLKGPFVVTFTYRAAAELLLSPDGIRDSVEAFKPSFMEAVDRVFPRMAPFDTDEHAHFSRALLSNLLGGLGFFHGDSKVDATNSSAHLETDLNFWEKAADAMKHATITTAPPMSLLSHVPSRPIFPRGFLWDEGFHLLPVMEWDLDLAISVLQSWLRLMDDDGWIAREQILGPEARSRVPEEFQVQYPHYANPPTLLLLLPILMSKLKSPSKYSGHPSRYLSSPDSASEMLRELYPLLARHYHWFRRTQAGNFSSQYPRPEDTIPSEGFRWRGRTPMHTMASGLDDYPRADPPHPGELHIDALAWVGASAHALQQVAQHLGEDSDAAIYEEHLGAAQHNLEVIHWDPVEAAYCDSTIDPEGDFQRVCRLGYLSLFPLLLGLLNPNSPHLPAVLDLLSDPARLWSPHGLRSLSATDPGYSRDEDYWRGAIWANLNVLAVLRLRDLGTEEGPEQERVRSLAARLRENLIGAVYDSWDQTGLFWEQYHDKTGEGRRSRAFTGWTACVILLLGLDLPVSEGAPGGRGGAGSSGGLSLAASVLLLTCLVVIVVFRRKLVDIGRATLHFCYARRSNEWYRGTYEEVIDLDELNH